MSFFILYPTIILQTNWVKHYPRPHNLQLQWHIYSTFYVIKFLTSPVFLGPVILCFLFSCLLYYFEGAYTNIKETRKFSKWKSWLLFPYFSISIILVIDQLLLLSPLLQEVAIYSIRYPIYPLNSRLHLFSHESTSLVW